ncbi:Juvenile hormone acid O-methyltransferase like protein [Argiope bruennichi]|uniref:Juvenile hormone acid O-methyltransferase like protein n=1 Tax=Argiope bruennichi TaxID=94029 RepID=A0A8T0EVE7_ARGBR|nr:Juvenile hormone acid O-methyltransferase like protein [Argiope bruennichi]
MYEKEDVVDIDKFEQQIKVIYKSKNVDGFCLALNRKIADAVGESKINFEYDSPAATFTAHIPEGVELQILKESKLLYMLHMPNEDTILSSSANYRFRLSQQSSVDIELKIIDSTPRSILEVDTEMSAMFGKMTINKPRVLFEILKRHQAARNMDELIKFEYDSHTFEVSIILSKYVEVHIEKSTGSSLLQIYKKIDRPWDSVVRFVNVTLPEMGWGDGESQEVVMDVGCGPGRLTSKFILPRFPNLKELIALDIIPEMIEAAKSLYPHPKVEYVVADFDDRSSIEKWKGQLTKFVSIHCFNRLKHQKQAFETVYQLLKPKGEAAVLFLLRNGYYDAIMKLSKDPKWSEYLNFDVTECIPQSQQQNLNSFHFKKIVEDIGFTVLHCQETQNVTTFQSDEEYKYALWDHIDLFNKSGWSIQHWWNSVFFLPHLGQLNCQATSFFERLDHWPQTLDPYKKRALAASSPFRFKCFGIKARSSNERIFVTV